MNTSLQESLRQFERKQLIVSLLGLLIIIGLSVISNRVFMQSSAEQTTNLITRMVQNGYFHEIELTLQSAKLDYFHSIRFNSKALNRSFVFPALAEYVHEKSLVDSLLYEKIEIHPQIMSSNSNEEVISFEYNRFGFVVYGLVIWLILNLVSIPQTRLIRNRIIEQFNRDLELNKKSAQAEISRKVRHNINTPLAALIAMTDRLEKLGKNDQLLFESIVKQIKSLVKDLDTSENGLSARITPDGAISIFKIVQDSFEEVRAAFANKYEMEFDIQNSLMSGKTSLITHEFRSIISNLVQNAADATPIGGRILLTARDLSNLVEIKIKDSGRGMSPEVLKRATEKNFTSGKVNGSGLGLYHAKTYVDSWGGKLFIESTEGAGTVITILLPISERASWFTPRLKLKSSQTVVILDDQMSQHHVWDLKLAENEFHGIVKKFSSPEEFAHYQEQSSNFSDGADYVFFFDYDLGDDVPRGVDLLKRVPASSQRHLVTGHFDEREIQEVCEQEKIFLIPKVDLPEMPMVVIPTVSQ